MEKAKKGDLKMPMLKAKMMKGGKSETAKQTPISSLTAQPMGAMEMPSASQPEMGGITAVTPKFTIEKPKPKLEGEVELFGPTEVSGYAPVGNYIKKRGQK